MTPYFSSPLACGSHKQKLNIIIIWCCVYPRLLCDGSSTFNNTIKIFPQATLQNVTILVAMAPKILNLVT